MTKIMLRELCGVRSGDKGNLSDLSLFVDDEATYDALVEVVTADAVAEHFGDLATGPVERFEARNVLALKFVLHGALGGGGPRSLRSDNLGKTLGGALLRMEVDVADSIIAASTRAGRRAPIDRTPVG